MKRKTARMIQLLLADGFLLLFLNGGLPCELLRLLFLFKFSTLGILVGFITALHYFGWEMNETIIAD